MQNLNLCAVQYCYIIKKYYKMAKIAGWRLASILGREELPTPANI